MASDDIFILGIHMTKFGKYPDKDVTDLAAEAACCPRDQGARSMVLRIRCHMPLPIHAATF